MKVLLHFNDDSTLFFVARLIDELTPLGVECFSYYMKLENRDDIVSQRQMEMFLPKGPDFSVTSIQPEMIEDFDAFITCKPTRDLRTFIANKRYMKRKDRPCFVTFQPGLEFTPEKGLQNRKNFDVIFLNSQNDSDTYGHLLTSPRWRHVSWGHPYFRLPENFNEDTGGPIYFFAQAISPSTYGGRMHVTEVLRAIALANPSRKVVIKLRHLPSENTGHVHQEEHNYPDLLKDLQDVPENIELSACSLKDALDDASLVVTCTSTAAMDAISAGLPTLVYTDYVECYRDPMAEAMNLLCKGSGLVSPLEDTLNLNYAKPAPQWIASNFRNQAVYEELLASITAFKNGTDANF